MQHMESSGETWPLKVVGGEIVRYFRIERALTPGGMGDVFLAYDERLERRVVLKRVRADRTVHEGVRRLQREACMGAQLRHPNIAIIYALEYVGFDPVLVQEYIAGEDLNTLVGKLPPPEVFRIAASVADALSHAHERGIMHRDVKPQNVRLTPDRTPIVLDFGLGKMFISTPNAKTDVQLSDANMIVGTAAYMAPEAWTGKSDQKTDVFAFGVALFELLSGQRPFKAEGAAIVTEILKNDVPPLTCEGIPSDVEELIKECLAPKPDDRPLMVQVRDRLLRFVNTISEPEETSEAPLVTGDQRSEWSRGQIAVGRRQVGNGITFEAAVTLSVPKSLLNVEQTLQGVWREPLRVGRITGATLTRSKAGLTAIVSDERGVAYWTFRATGELVYVASIPATQMTISLHTLLDETIHIVSYAARCASAFGLDADAEVLVNVTLQNIGLHVIADGGWPHDTVETLARKRTHPRENISSSIAATARRLKEGLPAILKVLVDELLRDEFIAIPEARLARQVTAALGLLAR